MSDKSLPSRDEIALRFLVARFAGNPKFSLVKLDEDTCRAAFSAADVFLRLARTQSPGEGYAAPARGEQAEDR
jgi:hypothetical protein